MWSALLKLLTQRPDLLVEHVNSYADIAHAELQDLRMRWTQRMLAGLAALLLGVVALTVSSVAVMLIAADVAVASWFLFTPALLLAALSFTFAVIAKRRRGPPVRSSAFDSLRKDLALLSELGAHR